MQNGSKSFCNIPSLKCKIFATYFPLPFFEKPFVQILLAATVQKKKTALMLDKEKFYLQQLSLSHPLRTKSANKIYNGNDSDIIEHHHTAQPLNKNNIGA